MPDRDYIAARNKLIPEAERHADRVAQAYGLASWSEAYKERWNHVFHQTMDVLWIQQGSELYKREVNGRR